MTCVETPEQLAAVLESLEMCGTLFERWRFDWKWVPASDEDQRGWNVQCSFERPNVDLRVGGIEQGFGRKWFVACGTPVTGVVFTAWLAIKQIAEHELMEAFTVRLDGERVRLLDPHKTLADVAHGSRRVG